MPDAPPAGPGRRAALLVATTAVFIAGCSGPSPPAGPTTPIETAPQADAALQCMPTALVSLRLPLDEGLALAHDQVPTSPAVVDCVFSLLGDRPLKSPAAFDRAYGRVFAYHEEDGTLALSALPRDRVQLFRLGATDDANVWLLRVDSGFEMDGVRHDVLFSTDRAGGALVDQLLVGAMGMLYRRDYDIGAVDTFAIREDTGRGDEAGPGYRARYRVEADGRYALVSSDVVPASSGNRHGPE